MTRAACDHEVSLPPPFTSRAGLAIVPRVTDPSIRRLSRLVPLEEALVRLAPFLRPVAPAVLPLREAAGKVLAGPLSAPRDLPPAAIAIIDGYAVPAAEVQGASPYAPVLVPGAALVEAGGAMPPETDAVIAGHFVRLARGTAEILGEVAPGEGAAAPGEDLSAGCVIRAAGERLRPVDLSIALAAGLVDVAVRAPRTALLLTGNEIAKDPDRDSLVPMLSGAVAAAGGTIAGTILLPDDEQQIAAALRAADADLVLVTGGTGLGASDRSVAALEAGGTLLAHGIAMRPGTTAALGHVGGVPAILLPGRLSESFGALLLLALPVLRRLAGAAEPSPRRLRLTKKIVSQAGFAEIALLRCAGDAAEPLATGALPLSAIATADGYTVVPAALEGFEAGASVPVLDIPA